MTDHTPRPRTGSSERETVEMLRRRVAERKDRQPARPTAAQVATIVKDLTDGVDLAGTAAKLGHQDRIQAETLILDVVATFGTWLAHSIGRVDASPVYAVEDVQPQLFPTEHLESAKVAESTIGAKRRNKKAAKAASTALAPGSVLIPSGYEPGGRHRRDLDKALCTILVHRPCPETVARFVARTYTTRSSQLSYPIVAGVWGFAQRHRLETIDMVSNDHVFQTQVLEAFDLLDVAREDAVKAFGDLLGGVTPDAAETLNVHDRAFWLDEQSFATLRKICTDGRGDTSRRLARELDLLRQRVHARPERYFPQTIGSLTLGQVRRICANAGIRVEPENRGEETEIRMALKAMGLSADADKLVPEALRCAEHGKIDDFWDIMKARKDGDPDWSDQLRELAHAP